MLFYVISGTICYFGFYGEKAVFYNYTKQQKIFSVNCGGHKRPSDFFFEEKLGGEKGGEVTFVFHRQDNILVSQSQPQEELFNKSVLRPNYHGMHINSCQFVLLRMLFDVS